MDGPLHRGFIVGEFRVLPAEHRIESSTGSQRLSAQATALLEFLARHQGELVGRRQLVRQYWSSHRHPRQALARCISDLRHRLRDDRSQPRYIETVPGRGYRLIATVRPVTNALEGVAHNPGVQNPHQRWSNFLVELRHRNVCRAALTYIVVVWLIFQVAEIVIPALQLPGWTLTLIVLLGIMGFPLVGVLAWVLEVTPQGVVIDLPRAGRIPSTRISRFDAATTAAMLIFACLISAQLALARFSVDGDSADVEGGIKTIAIRPFSSLSQSGGLDSLGTGIADELRRILLDDGRLRVAAAPAVPGSEGTIDTDAVLEGSLTIGPAGIRAVVRLVDARSGYDLWSTAITQPGVPAPDAHIDLAKRIASELPTPMAPSPVATDVSQLSSSADGLASLRTDRAP